MAIRTHRGARDADRQHAPPDRQAVAVVRDVGGASLPAGAAPRPFPLQTTRSGIFSPGSSVEAHGRETPRLYEVLTGYRQFPETNALERGDPIGLSRPNNQRPESVERGDHVCGRASGTSRRRDRARRAVAGPFPRCVSATTRSPLPCSQPRTRSTCTLRCASSSAAAPSISHSRSSSNHRAPTSSGT